MSRAIYLSVALFSCGNFDSYVRLKADALLKEVLEKSKVGVDAAIVDCIDSLLGLVKRANLRQELEAVLTVWGVNRHGLWSLLGSKSIAGLKEIRDKFSHNDPKDMASQGLVVATWHLSILVERILLAMLKIPICDSSAGGKRYRPDEWVNPALLLAQQKKIFVR